MSEFSAALEIVVTLTAFMVSVAIERVLTAIGVLPR